MNKRIPFIFLSLGILALFSALFFGIIGAFQYIFPDLFEAFLPFQKTRPLHVSSVVAWIFFTATGGIYYYLKEHLLANSILPKIHLAVNAIAIIFIPSTLALGIFGGREYMEWSPVLSLFIVGSWILFGLHYFTKLMGTIKQWPVYMWMWGTGILFYLLTFTEAHLWLLDFIKADHIKDLTVQWKSYGSLVGSWNMLLYGTALYLLGQISNPKIYYSKEAFLLYFLGLTNLIFGWAHHVYIIPTEYWVRVLAYGVSMTEWLILFKMIWTWTAEDKLLDPKFKMVGKLLRAVDLWVLLNLFLALLISIPALNYYTHGTHITVAHSMGTTMGINTSILLASIYLIYTKHSNLDPAYTKRKAYFYLFNISLIVFWSALILSGIEKSYWIHQQEVVQHSFISLAQRPYMIVVAISGFGILTALYLLLKTPLKSFLQAIKGN